MLYRLLKFIIGIGMRLYYREIRVRNAHNLRHSGPMIIIANHPNTLIDAWMIGRSCKQPIHYLAKGTFFNTRFKRWILGSLNMIPINRQVDGNTSGVNNQNSFEACYKVLEAGKTLVIFPEGNSIMERQLRELKTGTARIALEVQKRNAFNLDLKIVPVGLFYSQAHRFRSSVYMNVGEGIKINNLSKEYESNINAAAKDLTSRFRTMLENVLVLSDSKEQEELMENLCDILHDKEDPNRVESRAQFMKTLHSRLDELQLMQPELMEKLQRLVNSFKWQAEQLELRTEFLEKRFRAQKYMYELLLSIFFFLIGLPIFLFGFLHSIIPFKLTDLLMPKLIKNIEYYAPVAILIGLVLYPLNYAFLLDLASWLFNLPTWGKVVYFCAMPISGLYAFHFTRFLGAISFRFRFLFLITRKAETLGSLRDKKEELRELLFSTDK